MPDSQQATAETAAHISVLERFQSWLIGLRYGGMARAEAEHIVSVDPEVTRRFCVGLVDGRLFFGVQEPELSWFRDLPWLHVACRRGGTRMSFVTEECVVSGATIPCFALSFLSDHREQIALISRYHYLDIRVVEPRTGPEEGLISISGSVLTTVDVVVTEDESCLPGLLAGRSPGGHKNRSVFKKIIK